MEFGAFGCPHCSQPQGFTTLSAQIAHIKKNHPDQPHSARITTPSGAYVDYFPHMDRIAPHMLVHVNPESGKMQGRLILGKEGRVDAVETHPELRRQGIATELWNTAKELHENMPGVPKPTHSGSRTTSGTKWAKAVGGEVPKLDGGRVVSQRQFRGVRWE